MAIWRTAGLDLLPAAALAAAGPAGYALAVAPRAGLPGDLAGVAAVALLALVTSAGRRQLVQRARAATLLATAQARAEVARGEADLAVERNRLARELHDVLAHTLGALSIQLGALETLVGIGTCPRGPVGVGAAHPQAGRRGPGRGPGRAGAARTAPSP